MLTHDKERLEKVFPEGVPEEVEDAVNKFQKRYHSNFGSGPMSGEMLTLVTLIADGSIGKREIIQQILGEQEKKEEPKPEQSAPAKPVKYENVNWFATAGGTPVICKTDQGDIEGVLVGVFRKGQDKGMIKVKLPGSPNDFDTFHKSQVTLKN